MSSKEVDSLMTETDSPMLSDEADEAVVAEAVVNTISGEDRLVAVKEQLSKGESVPKENVSTLLEWFGAERRGHRVVTRIRAALKVNDLLTSPDFESVPINGAVSFKISSAQQVPVAPRDPTHRISMLSAASNFPVSVAPNDTADKVITLMMTNDFSQIPVMNNRTLKGVVTWKSIAEKMHFKKSYTDAQSLMDPDGPVVVEKDATFFSVISILAEKSYALVKDKSGISGIITSSDLSRQYHLLAEPFLIVGEIEIGIRGLLELKLEKPDLQFGKFNATDDEIKSVDEMTFGQYCILFEKDEIWRKLGLSIDKKEFVAMMHNVREIRNDVMHFDPDGLENDDINNLKKVATFFKRLRDLGSFGS